MRRLRLRQKEAAAGPHRQPRGRDPSHHRRRSPAATRLTLARRGPVETHDAVDPLLRVHQQLPPPQLGSALGGREAGGGPRGRGHRSRPAAVLHPRQKRPRRYLSAAQWGRPASARRRRGRPPPAAEASAAISRKGRRTGNRAGRALGAARSLSGRRPH